MCLNIGIYYSIEKLMLNMYIGYNKKNLEKSPELLVKSLSLMRTYICRIHTYIYILVYVQVCMYSGEKSYSFHILYNFMARG